MSWNGGNHTLAIIGWTLAKIVQLGSKGGRPGFGFVCFLGVFWVGVWGGCPGGRKKRGVIVDELGRHGGNVNTDSFRDRKGSSKEITARY